MKKPEISTLATDPRLMGANDHPSWIRGSNCVYSATSGSGYRVSIKTVRGWKSYGTFRDLEAAKYVANVAILAEGCESQYELNSLSDSKNRDEIRAWRGSQGNAEIERYARERFNTIGANLKALQEIKEAELRQSARREAELSLQRAEELRILNEERAEAARRRLQPLLGLNNLELLKLIDSIGPYHPLYAIAVEEAKRRAATIKGSREA